MQLSSFSILNDECRRQQEGVKSSRNTVFTRKHGIHRKIQRDNERKIGITKKTMM
jgi:hypothetical protein